MNSPQKYRGIGLMSGTSVDGLDIAFCEFTLKDDTVTDHKILKTVTVDFPPALKERLVNCMSLKGLDLIQLDIDFGQWMGEQCNSFIRNNNISPDFIASHGHTVFHQPDAKLTYQTGSGNMIHEITGLPVVYDFRSLDVAKGGQGAPLVPVGDDLLFSDYQICMNLGGFANISFFDGQSRKAYDLAAVNIVLNTLANRLDKPFDTDGDLARSGSLIRELKDTLNDLPYYSKPYPKSLGKEWVLREIIPLIDRFNNESIEDLLHSYTCHTAEQITNQLNQIGSKYFKHSGCKVLTTGGGVYNKFLIDSIKGSLFKVQLVVPDQKTIEYKEALIFALMGLLRMKGIKNCLSSVTGAKNDSCCGILAGVGKF